MSNKINWVAFVLTISLSLTFGYLALYADGYIIDTIQSQSVPLVVVLIGFSQFLAWMVGTYFTSKVLKKADYTTVAYWVTAVAAVVAAATMVYVAPFSFSMPAAWGSRFLILGLVLLFLAAVAGPHVVAKLVMKRRAEAPAARDWKPFLQKTAIVSLVAAGLTYGYRHYDLTEDRSYWQEVMAKAEAGDGEAQVELALQYLGGKRFSGEGLTYDNAAALAWLKKAVDQEYEGAAYLLAQFYDGYFSEIEPADQYSEKALEMYRSAAEQGDSAAQWALGRKYEEGDGVEQDLVRAHMWFSLSGYASAPALVTDKMTPEQIAEAEALAAAWRAAHEKEEEPGD